MSVVLEVTDSAADLLTFNYIFRQSAAFQHEHMVIQLIT